MAIYKLAMQKVMMPYHYLSSTGLEADHTASVNDKAVDERGNPKSALVAIDIREDRLLYQNDSDYNLLSDEEKANAFYVTDDAALNRLIHFGALESVEKAPQQEQKSDEKASKKK